MTGQWGTIGRLTIDQSDSAVLSKEPPIWTMENSWADSQPFLSAIPTGTYLVKPHTSPSKNKQFGGKCFKLQDVKDRTDVLIHIGNWSRDTEGCILVGSSWNGNSKGQPDKRLMVANSTNTMQKMLTFLVNDFYMVVTERYRQ